MNKQDLGKHQFEYKTTNLSNISVELSEFDGATRIAQGSQYLYHGGKQITAVLIDGERIEPSSRFWNSLYSRFGLNRSFFKYFDHAEVFARISEKAPDDRVQVCIDRSATKPRLLAATGLNKPVLIYDDLLELLEQFTNTEKVTYSDGTVRSVHVPRIGNSEFAIAGDKFQNRFELHTPIDGYGMPNFYLSLLRLICSNGMVGMARTFKTTLQLGQGGVSVRYALQRALEGFQNESGYAQLHDRMDAAARSWASLNEQQSLYNLLLVLQRDKQLGGRGDTLVANFEKLTGRPMELYQHDPNIFSARRQATLPMECKVYEMMSFATEVATHQVSEESARRLQAWLGTMLAGEYDLEGSCDAFDDWRDFFLRENREKVQNAN